MRIIPVLYKRIIHEGIKYMFNQINDGFEWVQEGKGWATVKLDGRACMIRNGKLYKRYIVKLLRTDMQIDVKCPRLEFENEEIPPEWEPIGSGPDAVAGYWPGWLPVGRQPNDAIFNAAFSSSMSDGTYELVGPGIAGNPYNLTDYQLWDHAVPVIENPPRNFDDTRVWISSHFMEGLIWHHPDGNMAKVRRKDYGLDWPRGVEHSNRCAVENLIELKNKL